MDMDAVTAHLDRGWDLLSRGDTDGARVSAEHILERDEGSPEGLCLLGAIATTEGETEEGLELFQQAMDLDPGYGEPVLRAAELCVHGLGDLDLGLQFCRDAEAMQLSDDERLEARLLLAEAYLAMGRDDEAARSVRRLPGPPYQEPTNYLRLGRVLVGLGEVARAEEVLAEAMSFPDTRAEAHYFTGAALEQIGDVISGRRHMAHSLELERGSAPAQASLEEGQLGILMEHAMERLEPPVRAWFQGVPVTVFDLPPMELVTEGFDPRCPVFASGSPALAATVEGRDAGASDGAVTHLFIYRRNVERVGPDWHVMVEQLRLALEQGLEDLLDGGGES